MYAMRRYSHHNHFVLCTCITTLGTNGHVINSNALCILNYLLQIQAKTRTIVTRAETTIATKKQEKVKEIYITYIKDI